MEPQVLTRDGAYPVLLQNGSQAVGVGYNEPRDAVICGRCGIDGPHVHPVFRENNGDIRQGKDSAPWGHCFHSCAAFSGFAESMTIPVASVAKWSFWQLSLYHFYLIKVKKGMYRDAEAEVVKSWGSVYNKKRAQIKGN